MTAAIRITDDHRTARAARQGQPHVKRKDAWRTVQRLRDRSRRKQVNLAGDHSDLVTLRERVQYLRQLGEHGRMTLLREAIEIELFLVPEKDWQNNMFLQALRIRLTRPNRDSRQVALIRHHAGCARFGGLHRVLRSFELIQLATELATKEFISDATTERR